MKNAPNSAATPTMMSPALTSASSVLSSRSKVPIAPNTPAAIPTTIRMPIPDMIGNRINSRSFCRTVHEILISFQVLPRVRNIVPAPYSARRGLRA